MVVGGNGIRSRETQAPFQILLYDEAGRISSGSAFIYETESQSFIITNWHIVSGKDFLTGDAVTTSRFPTVLKARFATRTGRNSEFIMVAQKIPIYEQDAEGFTHPIWLEHKHFGRFCDVVAIPFERLQTIPEHLHVPVNKIHPNRIPVRPGSSIFVIGFPQNLSVHVGWPLWKSGYVASEPFYDVTIKGKLVEVGGHQGGHTLPAFFIDTLTRAGMSGSPVFAYYNGGPWDLEDPYRRGVPGTLY